MTLSVVLLTRGPGAGVLGLFRGVADELVAALDAAAGPGAEAELAAVADVVVRIPWPEPPGRALGWLHAQCRGDWVLRLGEDDVPSRALLDALPGLVAARDVTHYLLPVGIRQEYEARLLANDPRLLRLPDVLGPARYLEAGLLSFSDVLGSDDAALEDVEVVADALAAGGGAPRAEIRSATQADVDALWPERPLGREAAVELFGEVPGPVVVRVENRSGGDWPWGRVSLVQRWLQGGTEADGPATPLPAALAAGGSALVPVVVAGPPGTGRWTLEVDLAADEERFGAAARAEVDAGGAPPPAPPPAPVPAPGPEPEAAPEEEQPRRRGIFNRGRA